MLAFSQSFASGAPRYSAGKLPAVLSQCRRETIASGIGQNVAAVNQAENETGELAHNSSDRGRYLCLCLICAYCGAVRP